MTCVSHTSYFWTPEFIFQALHITNILGVPLQVLGAWLIVFRTPKKMSSVKWTMLNSLLWSAALDFTFSVLTTPFAMFPIIGGYTMGLLHRLGVPTSIEIHMNITGFGMVLMALMTVYENRFFILSNKSSAWKDKRRWFLTGYYALMATFLIPFTATVPEQQSAVKEVYDRLPCLAATVDKSVVFVYTLRFSPAFIFCGTLFIITPIVIITFIVLTIRVLTQDSEHYSKETVRLQKRFLYGLMGQTSVPLMAMLIPFCHMASTILGVYYDQAYNNLTILAFSIHGLLSTFAMIVIHHPYRTATLEMFIRCRSKPETRIVDVIKV